MNTWSSVRTQLNVSLTRSAAVNNNQPLYTTKDKRGLRINKDAILNYCDSFHLWGKKEEKNIPINTKG